MLPDRYQLRTRSPVIGVVEMSVKPGHGKQGVIEPTRAHGLWLKFQIARLCFTQGGQPPTVEGEPL